LRNEGEIEDLRYRITRKPGFSFSEAFSAVDSNGNGFLSKEEFNKLLEDH
jgi:Ca2+-binding EF-hand superfamily protein